jgi:hypothetical protein
MPGFNPGKLMSQCKSGQYHKPALEVILWKIKKNPGGIILIPSGIKAGLLEN